MATTAATPAAEASGYTLQRSSTVMASAICYWCHGVACFCMPPSPSGGLGVATGHQTAFGAEQHWSQCNTTETGLHTHETWADLEKGISQWGYLCM